MHEGNLHILPFKHSNRLQWASRLCIIVEKYVLLLLHNFVFDSTQSGLSLTPAPPLAAGQSRHIPFVCLFFGDFGFYKRENIHRISKYACISKLSFRISPCKKQNHTIRRETCCFSDPHLPIFILPPSCPQLGYFLDTHDPLLVLPPPPGYVDVSRIQAKRYDAQAPR